MHGSIQLIIATETDRIRQADAARARSSSAGRRNLKDALVARLLPRRAAVAGLPSRAAPGTDARHLGHPHTASR